MQVIIFVAKSLMYMGMVLYAPALALSTLTTIPIAAAIIATGAAATLYTVHEGMKSVMWTEFAQSIMVLCMVTLTFGLATHLSGGFARIWGILERHGMLIGGGLLRVAAVHTYEPPWLPIFQSCQPHRSVH